MQCPTCLKEIHFAEKGSYTYSFYDAVPPFENCDELSGFDIAHGVCPSCRNVIVLVRVGEYEQLGEFQYGISGVKIEKIIFPDIIPKKLEKEIPESYGKDYEEAALVLRISPKASAAISRRLLQNILRDEFKIKPSSLSKEIDTFLSKKDIPTYLGNAIDAIRNIGNFAAHPLKDTNTGEIQNVESGEAEWLLEVLESLFDFTFIQPKRLEERKNNLNKKLSSMGKPPMK